MRNKLVLWLASGLGLGYAPLIPGTFGTLLGIGIYYFAGRLEIWVYVAFVLLFFLFSVLVSEKAEQVLLTHDPQVITIDEVVGYLITMLTFPTSWKWLLAGFIVFRLFDIIKPWPGNYFDNQGKGGLSTVMDDVIAGIYANVLLQILRFIL